MKVIEVQELKKTFTNLFTRKKVHALAGVDLTVNQGEIFGLLGPNGAGKTTMVKILLSICFASAGNAKLFGEPVKKSASRHRVGYLPESHKYPPYLKGKHVMDYYAKLSGMRGSRRRESISNLLRLVRMEDWTNVKMGKYSKGMQQRVGLAVAMVSDPDLLVLDEPTDGVDPIGRKEIRDILTELKQRGKTIFLNSHLLSEVELICDRIAILNKGKIVTEGSVEELTDVGNFWSISLESAPQDYHKTLANKGINIQTDTDNELIIEAQDATAINAVIDAIRNDNVLITAIRKKRQTLEDMFIDVITSDGEAGVK